MKIEDMKVGMEVRLRKEYTLGFNTSTLTVKSCDIERNYFVSLLEDTKHYPEYYESVPEPKEESND